MQNLPIHHVLPEIITALQKHNRLVLEAPPGAGKTTMVPLALLKEPWLESQKIIMLEPRRLATRNAAVRMASLLNEKVGETVGYQIRAERCLSAKTRILVVTEGILTRMLQSDPALEGFALVIFDEFHERNLHGDLALALSLQSQALLREALKIMVMSATLNTDAISQLLDNAPVVSSHGKSFPVKEHYLENSVTHPDPREISKLMTQMILKALKEQEGSVLAFLPGVREIKQVEKALHEATEDLIIAPLYGEMDKTSQLTAIAKAERRKVVLATNIAESSLTIEGITIVVDSGLHRHITYDSGSGMNRLQTGFISQDSATQRSGRAGRLSPGHCYRLWHRHRPLQQHAQAEILNSDLTPLVLELAHWGVEAVSELQWLDLPPAKAVRDAQALLEQLGALKALNITPHGRQILELGVHPRLAHMMLKANALGHKKAGTVVAALLSEKEIFTAQARRSADLSERVDTVMHRSTAGDIDRSALHRVLETAKNFERKLSKTPGRSDYSHETPGLLLAFAYPDRIAKCRTPNGTNYLLANGKGATLPKEDTLFGETFLVIADLDAGERNARIYAAAALDETMICEALSDLITTDKIVRWNDTVQRAEAREQKRLGAIILQEKSTSEISKEEITSALIAAVREKGLSALPFSKEALALQQRVNFLNYWAARDKTLSKQAEGFADLTDEALLETLDDWLSLHLEGITSFKALKKLNMQQILLGRLSWEQQSLLNTLVPLKLKVPSGSNITIDYHDPATPLLSVRLQELFGMLETPTLLEHRVTLTIELLSPARRPMQVTKDLKSFWENTYDEVKKELRGKYKKHYWPDDPYEAVATSKTKKHM